MSVAFIPDRMCSGCTEIACARRTNTTMPERITNLAARAIIAEVLLATGVPGSDVFSSDRRHHVAMCRALIATRLRMELDYGFEALGELMGRHHSSVIAMVRKVRRAAT